MSPQFSPLESERAASADAGLKSWTTSDGATLSVQQWVPRPAPRAIIVAIHGLCGAATDFAPLGEYFLKRSIATYSFDMRSQAFDPDVKGRGHMRDFRLLVRDVAEFCSVIEQHHPAIPRILFGESMGGMLSILASTHTPALPVDLLILNAPVVALHMKPANWQNALLAILHRVAPRLRVVPAAFTPKNAPPIRLTRDDDYEAFLKSAPQQMQSFTLGFLSNLKTMMETANRSAELIRHPSLTLYAEHDIFVPPSAVEDFDLRILHPDHSLRYYHGNYHLLLHDLDREKVLLDVDEWLEAHLVQERGATP